MKRTIFACAATLGAFLAIACGQSNVMVPDPDVPSTTTTTPATSAPASSAINTAPCGPNDCKPCDETKQKCMGPSVCSNHPEKASRQCKRDTDGQCKDMIVCAP